MSINNTSFSTVGSLYNNATQSSGTFTASSSVTVQGISGDVLQLGATSLFAGGNLARRIAATRDPDLPTDVSTRISNIGGNMFKVGRNSALVGGIFSAAKNTMDYVSGTITGSRIGGNVSADMIGALGGGILAAGTGTLAASAISSATGAGLVGLIVGTAAFIGTDILYKNSGVYQTISDKVTQYIDDIINRIKPPGGW